MKQFNFPDELINSLEKDNCIIFIGSGVSKQTASLPGWNKLTDELRTILAEEDVEIDSASNIEVLNLFESVFSRDKLLHEINDLLKYEVENIDWSLLQKVKDLNPHMIFTTNYDNLIESCFDSLDENYYKAGLDFDLSGWNYIDPLVLKLHGDLTNLHQDLVLTEEDYAIYHLEHPELYKFIRNQFLDKNILYIGFSLEDPNFRRLHYQLRWQARDLRSGERRMEKSYLVKKSPSDSEKRLLDEMDIEPVEVESHDKIPLLLDELRSKTSEIHSNRSSIGFDGVDDYIECETPFLNGIYNFSIRSEIYVPDDSGDGNYLFSMVDQNNQIRMGSKIIQGSDELSLKIFLYNPESEQYLTFASPSFKPDQWHEISIDSVNDDLRVKIGDEEQIHPITENRSAEFEKLEIGTSGMMDYYNGRMRFFRIYDYDRLNYLVDIEMDSSGKIRDRVGKTQEIGVHVN